MNENKYNIVNETIYSKKLSNGLMLYFYVTDKTQNFYTTISVKYGAKVIKYSKNNKEYTITPGSAHFLEHKVMNFDNYDIMKKLGSVANAYTSYDVTNYNIFGSKKIKENIKLLLDLVFNPNITKENVDSEKNIIKEEIDMKDDNINSFLYNKLRENLFNINYQVNSVIGKKSDIDNISEKELNRIYKDFYLPNNMFMIVCGNFDKDDLLKYIEEYFSNKKVNNNYVKNVIVKEPVKVKVEYEELSINSSVNRVLIGIKIPALEYKNLSKEEISAYISLIVSCKFRGTSKLYNNYKNDKIINSMYTFVDFYDDYYVITISATVPDQDLFIKNIKNDIKSLNVNKSDFERKKKLLVSNCILNFETIESIESSIVDEIINYDRLLLNQFEIIKSINYETALEIIKKLDISNYSILKASKKELISK